MTDFHSHVLPGIDDGSPDVSTSLKMLEMWREQDISRICATPHFDSRRTDPDSFLKKRDEALAELKEAADGGTVIIPGAEVRFFDGMTVSNRLGSLCLDGTDMLLLEMPFSKWTDRMLRDITEIRRRGIRPVLAHIERYLGMIPLSLVHSLSGEGIMMQCNAEFFLERRTRRKALSLFRGGHVHFLGSDAHDSVSRPPDLRQALDIIVSKLGPEAEELLSRSEELIDAGRKVPHI